MHLDCLRRITSHSRSDLLMYFSRAFTADPKLFRVRPDFLSAPRRPLTPLLTTRFVQLVRLRACQPKPVQQKKGRWNGVGNSLIAASHRQRPLGPLGPRPAVLSVAPVLLVHSAPCACCPSPSLRGLSPRVCSFLMTLSSNDHLDRRTFHLCFSVLTRDQRDTQHWLIGG